MKRIYVILALVISGCAGAPQKQSQPAEDKKSDLSEQSKKYLSGFKPGPADIKGACAGVKSGTEKLTQYDWVAKLGACVSVKNWELTEALSEEMAKSDLESPWPGYFRSIAAMERGDLRRALWMIELAQKKVGNSDLMTYQKAKILLRLGRTKDGIEKMESALDINPKMVQARLYLAQTYRQSRDVEKALKHYEVLLSQEGSSKEALRFIADTRFERGQKADAVSLYNRLIDLGSEDSSIYLKVGQYHEELAQKNPQDTNSLISAIFVYRKLQADAKSGKVATNQDIATKIKDLETKLETSKTKKQASNNPPVPRGAK